MRCTLDFALVEPKAPGRTVFDLVRLPRLGVVILGTLAKRVPGAHVVVHIEEVAPLDIEEIANADLIGVSTTTSTAPSAYALCDEVKRRNPGATVVLGGVHVTFNPLEALEHCDHVFLGEADLTFPAFLEQMMKGDHSPPIIGHRLRDSFKQSLKRSPVEDIDHIPDVTLIKGWRKMHIAPVVTSRSCPFSCTFCSVIEMFGQRMRYVGVETVRKTLDQAHGLGFRKVFFYDDNFVVDVKRTTRLLEMIRRLPYRFRWSAQVRANTFARRPDLATTMFKAGCRMVYVGIESADPGALLAFNKRADIIEMTDGVRNLRKAGIMVHGMFVAGAETDTPASIRSCLRFAKRQRLSTVQFMILTPLPGTQDHERLERTGRVFDREWSHYDAHHAVHHPERMSAQRLQREVLAAMKRFYRPWRIVTTYFENIAHPQQGFFTMCLRAFGWVHVSSGARGLKPHTAALPATVKPKDPVTDIPNR